MDTNEEIPSGIITGRFVGRSQVIIQKLYDEGKVTFLSKEATSRIDIALAEGMQKIKEESDLLQRRSWAIMKDIIIS